MAKDDLKHRIAQQDAFGSLPTALPAARPSQVPRVSLKYLASGGQPVERCRYSRHRP